MATNYDFLLLAQNESKTFAMFTAELTKEEFDTRGVEALKKIDPDLVDDFLKLSLQAVMNKVRDNNVKDMLEIAGLGESYAHLEGEYLRRIYIRPLKPISPQYKNLVNYGSVDPFKIRKPEAIERFYRQNFDYQNLLTISDTELRKAFYSSEGLQNVLSGCLKNLDNDYKLQKYLAKMELIHKMINSENLKASQVVEAGLNDLTIENMEEFIIKLKNLISFFETSPMNSAYNMLSFDSSQNIEDLIILIRPEINNNLDTKILSKAFNPEYLNQKVKFLAVENFGGLQYFDNAEATEPLKPVYDELGVNIGFNASGSASDPIVENPEVRDPNKDVMAVVLDKKIMLTNQQQPYTIEPIRNPAGLYRNYWASEPNGTLAFDGSYNMIIFKNNITTKKQNKHKKKENV